MHNLNQYSTVEHLEVTGWYATSVVPSRQVDNVDMSIASAEVFGHERRAKEYVKSTWTRSIVTTSFSLSLSFPPEKRRPKPRSRSLENVPSRGYIRGFTVLFIR